MTQPKAVGGFDEADGRSTTSRFPLNLVLRSVMAIAARVQHAEPAYPNGGRMRCATNDDA
jgi:hypothetical protein